MAVSGKTGVGLNKALSWSARAAGLLASGLFLLFVAESGGARLSTLSWTSPREMPLFLALTVAVAGVTIAWRWELVGGAVAVVGALAVVQLVYLGAGLAMVPAAAVMVSPLFVAGILHVTCCCRTLATRLAREPKPQPQRSIDTVAVA
jgi:hypothetical protein